MEVWAGSGTTGYTLETIPDDSPIARTYRALQVAAERMGANNYQAQAREHLAKRGLANALPTRQARALRSMRFTVTAEHRAIVDAMPRVLRGDLAPEAAMGMLWEHGTRAQRLGPDDPYATRAARH
jgi:hypothetical protein